MKTHITIWNKAYHSYFLKIIILIIFICTNLHVCFASNITFPNACIQGQSIVIAAVGDVLLHTPLQEKASMKGFDSLWEAAISFIKKADIAYANLEGPMAAGMKREGDPSTYSSFPYFNYNPHLAFDLKKSGFDIVSTANNHALDRFSKGIDKTIESLDKAGLQYVGTRTKGSNQPWYRITTKDAFKIAWIACTEVTNDNPDDYHQILHCYGRHDRKEILKMISELKSKVDTIIVLPHWGEEYHSKPNSDQIEFAHQVLDAGATAVLGSHPHVLQPMQKYITKDGRSTLILYSLGNFVSYQGESNTRSTIILFMGLTKTPDGTIINGIRFVPMYMQNRGATKSLELTKMPVNQTNAESYKIISKVMPMGNVLKDEEPLITNPECIMQKTASQ